MSSKSILTQYFQLRKQIQESNNILKEIEDKAIDEGLNAISQENNTNQIAYYDPETRGKIVIVFKTKGVQTKDDLSLSRMNLDIDIELKRLSNLHRERLNEIDNEINKLKEQIASLENEQNQLLFSPYLGRLKNDVEAKHKELTYKVPTLAVYLN